jgi:hypothetical protein
MKRRLASRRLAEKVGRVGIVTPLYRWDTLHTRSGIAKGALISLKKWVEDAP